MGEPSVLFVKPQAIKSADKKLLSAAGVIVVEIDDPSAVRFVKAESIAPDLPYGVLLRCAAEVIKSSAQVTRDHFGSLVCTAIANATRPK